MPRTRTSLTETSADTHTLNERQRRFCDEYLIDGNGTQAAIRAGYSAHSASVQASQLLAQAKVRAHLQGRLRKRAAMADVTAANVLKQAQRLAFYDVRQMFDVNGMLLPINDLPDDVAASIQGIEVEQTAVGNRLKFKLADKGAGVDRLMRHLGMFGEDNAQQGSSVAQMLAEIHASGSRLPLK